VEFHPSVEEFDEERYLKLAESKKVVAIGEIGLDYFHNSGNKEKQKEVFSAQIEMAMKLDLPIIIHSRKSHDDVIEILIEKKKIYQEKLRGVVHCFSGRLSQAKTYTEELGFHLGFNGVVTFDRSYDKVLREVDMKYFLIETDCPYLTPIPFRGQRNEPAYVKYVAEKIAEIKEKDVFELERATTESAKGLFKI
jgi:TatD DNase family protein